MTHTNRNLRDLPEVTRTEEPQRHDFGPAIGLLAIAVSGLVVAAGGFAAWQLWRTPPASAPAATAARGAALTSDCPGPLREGDRTVVVVRLSAGQLVTTCRRITDPMSPERKP